MVKVKTLLLLMTYCSVALAYGSVIRYVHPAAHAGFWIVALAAAVRHRHRRFSVPRLLVNSLAVVVIFLSFIRIRADFLVEPLLDGLLVLSALKLLEADQFRDFMQTYLLCLFLLIGSGLMSLSARFLLYLVPLALLLTVSLILLTYENAMPDARLPSQAVTKIFSNALAMMFLTIPVALILFFILPRTKSPLLIFLNQAGIGKTGFSEQVSLGDVSVIQEDASVVFRARMEPLPDDQLYWRGIVLDRFDGTAWKPSPFVPASSWDVPKPGDVRQEIYIEPYGSRILFGLDRPIKVERITATRSVNGTFRMWSVIFAKTRYVVWSRLRMPFEEDLPDRELLLQIPETLSPKIRRLAGGLGSGKSPEERMKAALGYFRSGNFRYSVTDLPPDLEAFLFGSRKGNCEYFASALAVLLRLNGIPARLVGGYRGGYYNETGGYYLVLQKHAHVWTEAYLDGKGWIRLDPTPAQAWTPARIYSERLLVRLRLLMDVLNYYWFKLVVDYDADRQLALAHRARTLARRLMAASDVPSWNWRKVAVYGLFAGAVVFLAMGVVTALRTPRPSQAQILRKKLRERMKRYGYELHEWEGLEEFASRISDEKVRARVQDFARVFQEAVYKEDRLDGTTGRRLKRLLREI